MPVIRKKTIRNILQVERVRWLLWGSLHPKVGRPRNSVFICSGEKRHLTHERNWRVMSGGWQSSNSWNDPGATSKQMRLGRCTEKRYIFLSKGTLNTQFTQGAGTSEEFMQSMRELTFSKSWLTQEALMQGIRRWWMEQGPPRYTPICFLPWL